MTDRSFCCELLEAFLVGGAASAIFFATCHLVEKILEHDDDIKELFERVEECESSQES